MCYETRVPGDVDEERLLSLKQRADEPVPRVLVVAVGDVAGLGALRSGEDSVDDQSVDVVGVLANHSSYSAGWASAVPFRNDFAAYWPVGRLLLAGQNPYDAGAIESLQRSVGDMLGGDSIVRYPPWSLPLLLPFATLPYVPGWYLWILLQAVLVGVSSCTSR